MDGISGLITSGCDSKDWLDREHTGIRFMMRCMTSHYFRFPVCVCSVCVHLWIFPIEFFAGLLLPDTPEWLEWFACALFEVLRAAGDQD
jgi:hypothetical protein